MIKFSIRPNPPSRIRPFLLAFALLFLFANLALATDFSSQKRFTGFPENLWGYGLNFGEPTGVRANYFLDWKHALNFNVGYSFAKVLTGSANYLWYGYNANDRVLKKDFWNSLIFYGGGGLMAGPGLPGCDTGDKFQLGIQGVGGVEYLFTGSPWSVRREVLPQHLIMGRSNFH